MLKGGGVLKGGDTIDKNGEVVVVVELVNVYLPLYSVARATMLDGCVRARARICG